MGVHTGDSITVAPAMTLTDREYQHMRDIGDRHHPRGRRRHRRLQHPVRGRPGDGRHDRHRDEPAGLAVVSALASKATGFPIAKIAAKLAIGYTLDEIPNDITGETPACFEPTLDYVVVKVPRFAFEKFPAADPTLTTHMKSVGEAMAIGRNFTEALQKALRSLETKGCRARRAIARRATRTQLLDARRRGRTTAGCSAVVAGAARRRDRRARCTTRPGSTRGSSTRSR